MNLKQCLEKFQEEIQEPLRLLGESKNILNNHVKFCLVKHCSVEDYCTSCLRCKDLYAKIDKYLKGQQ